MTRSTVSRRPSRPSSASSPTRCGRCTLRTRRASRTAPASWRRPAERWAQRPSSTAAARTPRSACAKAAAIGEALERYCGMFVPYDRTIVATARELGTRCRRPCAIRTVQREPARGAGVPFRSIHGGHANGVRRGGVPGRRIARARARRARVPRPDRTDVAPDRLLHDERARVRRVAERGAAGCSSRARRAGRGDARLEQSALTAAPRLVGRRLVRRGSSSSTFAPTGLRYSVLDGSVFFGVPVTIAVLHGPPGSRAALAMGAGCSATMRGAWLKALSESFGVYRWLCMEIAGAPEQPLPQPGEVKTFDQHMLYYASEERAGLASFLDASAARATLEDAPELEGSTPSEQIGTVVRRLASREISAYAVDVTTPDVSVSRAARGARHRAGALCPRRLARGPVPGWLAAVHGSPRRGAPRNAAHARGAQPSSAPLSVNGVPEPALPTESTTDATSSADRVATIRLEQVLGVDDVRTPDATEDYHEASRLYSGLADPYLHGAARLERSPEMRITASRSVKRHPHRPRLPLPPAQLGSATLAEAMAARRSRHDYGSRPLALGELATLLHCAYGVTGRTGGAQTLRTVPSGGALYPLELYAACLRVEGTADGAVPLRPAGPHSRAPPANRSDRRGRTPDAL